MENYKNHINFGGDIEPRMLLASSPSFKPKKKATSVTAAVRRAGLQKVDDIVTLMHGSDPVRLELTRLENEIRESHRVAGEANAEIKALRHSLRLKEKAVEELTDMLGKSNNKLQGREAQVETKNLEIKKINEEKKEALVAQVAAEASLRRVHAAQKDDGMPPIEAIIAPLEAELKLARMEVANLQDDNRTLNRITKSKEDALLEAEHSVQMAQARASMIDDLQNKNLELIKQIGMSQEENKILDKMHRQKVAEVEMLSQTVQELEDALLSGGAAANAVRDYQRKVQEMEEEKRLLDRELARAKVSANRVAVVVANDWKDAKDKVMPVRQWLEERKFYQGEIHRLKDKLAIADRATKAEARMKDKYSLRFKVLEGKLLACLNGTVNDSSPERSMSTMRPRHLSLQGHENSALTAFRGSPARKDEVHEPSRASNVGLLSNHATNLSCFSNGGSRSTINENPVSYTSKKDDQPTCLSETQNSGAITHLENGSCCVDLRIKDDDSISGMLYDILQKEVIMLQKVCQKKDQHLKDKNEAIEMLAKKVETLNKAMEVEAKKMRREVAAIEKQYSFTHDRKVHDRRSARCIATKGTIIGSQTLLSRNGP